MTPRPTKPTRKPAAKAQRKPTTPKGHWPTRRAALDGIEAATGHRPSLATMQRWTAVPGCPMPTGGGPIPIEATLAWIRSRPGPGPLAAPNPEREVRTKLLERKLAQLDGQSISVAAVEADVVRGTALLKAALLEDLPVRLHAACVGKTFDDAEGSMKALLTEAINAFAAECLASTKTA